MKTPRFLVLAYSSASCAGDSFSPITLGTCSFNISASDATSAPIASWRGVCGSAVSSFPSPVSAHVIMTTISVRYANATVATGTVSDDSTPAMSRAGVARGWEKGVSRKWEILALWEAFVFGVVLIGPLGVMVGVGVAG